MIGKGNYRSLHTFIRVKKNVCHSFNIIIISLSHSNTFEKLFHPSKRRKVDDISTVKPNQLNRLLLERNCFI